MGSESDSLSGDITSEVEVGTWAQSLGKRQSVTDTQATVSWRGGAIWTDLVSPSGPDSSSSYLQVYSPHSPMGRPVLCPLPTALAISTFMGQVLDCFLCCLLF